MFRCKPHFIKRDQAFGLSSKAAVMDFIALSVHDDETHIEYFIKRLFVRTAFHIIIIYKAQYHPVFPFSQNKIRRVQFPFLILSYIFLRFGRQHTAQELPVKHNHLSGIRQV